jgi:TonB family protein
MNSPEYDYHYRSLVSAGDARKFAIASIVFHFFLAALFLTWGWWAPEGATLKLGGGDGGGSPIGVGLVANLPAGPELFKPLARAPEPAAQPVKAPPPLETPSKDEFAQVSKKTPPQPPPAKPAPPQPAAPEAKPAPPAPIGTAESTPGVRGGTGPAAGEGGEGSGQGVSIGGGGEGFYDSWYARQVEQRVGSNWLKSRMGIQFSGHQRVTIEFTVGPDGHIGDIKILETTGAEAFNRSALRAVQASDPLPPLPNQYKIQGNRIRFVAIFEYPTP